MSAVAPTKSVVHVIYGAADPVENFDFSGHQEVEALLNRAEDAFHITANRHVMSLFLNGKELPDKQSLEAAGVKAGDTLVLRQSTVKGG